MLTIDLPIAEVLASNQLNNLILVFKNDLFLLLKNFLLVTFYKITFFGSFFVKIKTVVPALTGLVTWTSLLWFSPPARVLVEHLDILVHDVVVCLAVCSTAFWRHILKGSSHIWERWAEGVVVWVRMSLRRWLVNFVQI
mgnify:FL=1